MNFSANNLNSLKDEKWTISWGSPKTWPRFFDQAKRVRARFFTTLYRSVETTTPGAHLNFSVIASKKNVSKSSVTRHRAKRRLKAAVAEVGKSLPFPKAALSLEWVLLADRKSVEAPWPLLIEEIRKTLLKVVAEAQNAD